jgi:hypothetical protein
VEGMASTPDAWPGMVERINDKIIRENKSVFFIWNSTVLDVALGELLILKSQDIITYVSSLI